LLGGLAVWVQCREVPEPHGQTPGLGQLQVEGGRLEALPGQEDPTGRGGPLVVVVVVVGVVGVVVDGADRVLQAGIRGISSW
jgi:hypothetical protein